MNKRIISITLFTLFLSVFLACFVGCNSNVPPESSDGPKQTITDSLSLSTSNLELLIGESEKITAVYEGNSQLQFSSEDENIIEVSSVGLVTAKNIGSAKVIATYGSAKAECLVTVTLGNLLPELSVNVEDSKLALYVGDGFELTTSVRFNNRIFSFTPSIEIADENIAVMKNGVITGKAYGQTTATVSGTWQGCKLEKEISVNVINSVSILVYDKTEDILVNSIELYTVDEIDGVSYSNLFNYDIVVKEGGELKTNYTVSTSSDIVSLDTINAQIKGESSGSGVLTVDFEDSFGNSYQKKIDINVIRPIVKSNKTLILSAYDGVVFDQKADGSMQSMSVVEYFGEDFAVCDCDGATIEEGRITGIDASEGITNASIVLYGERYGYIVDVLAYTLIFDEKEDFSYFTLDNESVNFGGYYILANNIDANGYTHSNIRLAGKGTGDYNDKIGLTGTFDGRGYTVSKITIGGQLINKNNIWWFWLVWYSQ